MLVVTVEGQEYVTDDLTLDEACTVEAETGESWLRINPLRQATHARALLHVLYARTHPVSEAQKIVGALTIAETLGHIRVETNRDDDLPDEFQDGLPDPKADGQATT